MTAVAAAGLLTRIGKYEVLTPIASGGMARIYIARTTGIGAFERHVVLKMILPERAHDQVAVQMFLDEARLAASLNHQNVAQVFEVGEDGGTHFLAMEYVHGQDLRALLAKAGSEGTRVPIELALTIATGAAAGLHHAHERRTSDGIPMGIVHRDVSPSNLMVGYDGSVKLLDFGIAKATMRSVETQSGIIKGKFAYMSPEQCRGRDVDRRSDVFSLGIILYEVTTQHRCFRADSDFDTMHRIVTGDIVRPTRLVLGYPAELEAIVMRALTVDPDDRYASASDLLEAIEIFAATTRMSLSTMSLGRFMRDMFGDVQEPWLSPSRGDGPPQREYTVSNTNGSASIVIEHAMTQMPTTLHDDDEPADAPMHLPPGSTQMLEIPTGPSGIEADVNEVESWSVQPYPIGAQLGPQPGPQRGAQPAAPQLYDPYTGRLSSPHMPMPPQIPSTALGPYGTPASSPSIAPPLFASQGSASGPSHPSYASAQAYGAQGFGQTRQGYDGAPSASGDYPRYEPPADEPSYDSDPPSSSRMLYIGLAIVAIGVVAIIYIMRHNDDDVGGDDPPTTAPTAQNPHAGPGTQPGSDTPAPVNPPPAPADPPPVHAGVGSGSGSQQAIAPTLPVTPPPLRDEILVHIGSNPPGAQVVLLDRVLGATPLDIHMKRATGAASLIVRLPRYQDEVAVVDLSGNYTREMTLKLHEDTAVQPTAAPNPPPVNPGGGSQTRPPGGGGGGGKTSSPHEHTDHGDHNGGGGNHAPAANKKCQPPGSFNPFDDSCNGEACPACPSK